MKKRKLLLSMCLLVSIVVCANPYKHSLGINAGGFNGLSYKLWKNNFAFQMDVGTRVSVGCATQATLSRTTTTSPSNWFYATIEAVPTFMFQKSVYSSSICEIAPFFGAGVSLGYMDPKGLAMSLTEDEYTFTIASKEGMGKFGVHTSLGVEFAFLKSMSLGINFTPGYGLGFGYLNGEAQYVETSGYYNYRGKYIVTDTYTRTKSSYSWCQMRFFDWSLALAMRFYI